MTHQPLYTFIMSKIIIIFLCVLLSIGANCQTRINATNVLIKRSLRPPLDTLLSPFYYNFEMRYKTSDRKWYVAKSLIGKKWYEVNTVDTNVWPQKLVCKRYFDYGRHVNIMLSL